MTEDFEKLWKKLEKSKRYRDHFVAAHSKRLLPFQIRVLMKQHGLSQEKLAERAGLTQGVISRAADPNYGNLTVNTIVKIANGFDVAYLGIFVPFSELAQWFSSLSESAVQVDNFEEEDKKLSLPPQPEIELPELPALEQAGVGGKEEPHQLGSALNAIKQRQELAATWRH